MTTNTAYTGSYSFDLKDNYFYQATVVQTATASGSYNGYRSSSRVLPTSGNDQVLTSFYFTNGPLGHFYYVTTNLMDKGSRSVADAGLYHFTTQTNYVKDTNTVDIGFHYVATTNDVPYDFDRTNVWTVSDGVPDYIEDRNGNGTKDAAETDWMDPDTDYDGRSDGQEWTAGTNPLDASDLTQVRLAYWNFNSTNWLGDSGQTWITNVSTTNVNGIATPSGPTSALMMTNTDSILVYRDVETNGVANINLRSGSVSFWFKPNWTTKDIGNGPGDQARLIQLGNFANTPTGWWTLMVNSDGTELRFYTATNGIGFETNLVTADIFWYSNIWNQVVFTYDTNETKLYLNGFLAATGSGIPYYPGSDIRNRGLVIGANYLANYQCNGAIEDVETYNFTITDTTVQQNYQTNAAKRVTGLRLSLNGDSTFTTLWRDLSGNTNHAFQLDTNFQPQFVGGVLNGHTVARFDGTNDLFTLSTFKTNLVLFGAEIFYLHKSSRDTQQTNGFSSFGNAGSGGDNVRYPDSGGNILDNFGSQTRNVTYSPIQDLRQFHLYDVVSIPGEWSSRVNGLLYFTRASGSPNVVSFKAQPVIGAATASATGVNCFAGDIAEILMYDHKLTDGEREVVTIYLNGKYAYITNVISTPTNLQSYAVSSNQINVTWNGAVTNFGIIYHLERKTNGGPFRRVADVVNAMSYFDKNLATNTEYFYRVFAENDVAVTGYSNTNTATTYSNRVEFLLSDVRCWYRADGVVARATTNNTVAFWIDESTNRIHLYQTNLTNQALLIVDTTNLNNRPVVRFDNSENMLLTNAIYGLTEAEIFAVPKCNAAVGVDSGFWDLGSTPTTRFVTADNMIYDNFCVNSPYGWGVTNNMHNYNLYNVSVNSNWTARINGIVSPNILNAYTNFLDGSSILAIPYQHYQFNGDFAEVLLFRRALSTNERATINNYFYQKYGIQGQ